MRSSLSILALAFALSGCPFVRHELGEPGPPREPAAISGVVQGREGKETFALHGASVLLMPMKEDPASVNGAIAAALADRGGRFRLDPPAPELDGEMLKLVVRADGYHDRVRPFLYQRARPARLTIVLERITVEGR